MVDATLFEEIPESVRQSIDQELRIAVLDILHAEAVEAGDLPPSPKPLFDTIVGKLLLLLFQILAGALIGFGAVALTLWLMRSLAAILS